jgi:geranylgeranyl diphosphate synthase type II
MDATTRIEQALSAVVANAEGPLCPPRLAAAIRYAVFPGGARIRPRLALAVAWACGDDAPGVSDAVAASIELLHCASLVHDDLPCFDDAPIRRGKPSVHKAFGQRLAVLAGDALIVLAFEALAHGVATRPERLAKLTLIVGQSVGMTSGIIAGQAWECEPRIVLADYHRAKTAALFAAASAAGAVAAGADGDSWRTFGERLGEAYQVADDIRDVAASAEDLGKPIGQDQAHDRPSAARQLGVAGAVERLQELVNSAVEAIPACPGEEDLRNLIRSEVMRLLPKELMRRVA